MQARGLPLLTHPASPLPHAADQWRFVVVLGSDTDREPQIEVVDPQPADRHLHDRPISDHWWEVDAHYLFFLDHPLLATVRTRKEPRTPRPAAGRTRREDRDPERKDPAAHGFLRR